jgi:hypothetical protein
MFAPSAPIPWDQIVEIFSADTGRSLHVVRKDMTLRQAVQVYIDTPEDARTSLGIGIHKPILTTMDGRPVAVGFLNAADIAILAERLPDDHE